MSLTAPVAGLVASRLVEVGQAVQPGQPMLSLLPEGSQLRAQLLVPSAAIGFVKKGDQVLLRYKAHPYQKFGSHIGRVIRVSRRFGLKSPMQVQVSMGTWLWGPFQRLSTCAGSGPALPGGRGQSVMWPINGQPPNPLR